MKWAWARLAPRSLAVQLLVLLTIALLPLGSIAVYQTLSVVAETADLERRDVRRRTAEAARALLGLIQQAQGAAHGMGAVAVQTGTASPECGAIMRRFVDVDPRFVFAGFIRADGLMECSSEGKTIDFGEVGDWEAYRADPHPTLGVNRQGAATGLSVMIVTVPIVSETGEFMGAASISIPHGLSDIMFDKQIEDLKLAIIDHGGNTLSASTGINDTSTFDALGLRPDELAIPRDGLTLEAEIDGAATTVAVVPLMPGETYLVGKWMASAHPISQNVLGTVAPAFPIVMWLASLFVAFLALNRLVFRHLKVLRRHMRRFSIDNLEASYVQLEDAPRELSEIAASYNALLDRITDDTIELAESVREKEILLKEIHHRVKNNLQLIASILNMQLRQIDSPEAKSVLRRVQDRVMSLATIHKLLYSDTQVDTVRADLLLKEIIASSMNFDDTDRTPLETDIHLAPVELDPDQAVPLSLLATEALTNALKYAGASGDGPATLSVSLSEPSPAHVEFIIANSRAPDAPSKPADATGLGTRLIQAFVSQLGGTLEIESGVDRHGLTVRFTKLGHQAAGAEAA